MINRRAAVALLVLIAPLAACVTGSDSSTATPFQAKFIPLDGIMPFPNDLYFGATSTGQLNIPGSTTQAANVPVLEMNHLDGFGTESDISIYFNEPVDASTLATNVLMFKVSSSASTKGVNPPAPFGTGTMTKLTAGTDYSIQLSPGSDSGGEVVTIKPLHPLAASTIVGSTPVPATYLVVVKTGVKDTNGNAVGPSSDYSAIVAADTPVLTGGSMVTTGNTSLDAVAEFTLPQIIDADVAGVTPAQLALTFSFSTAYLGVSLAEISATATATPQPTGTGIYDTGLTDCAVLVASDQLPNATACAAVPGSTTSEIFAGDVALPYYLTVPASGSNAALTDNWKNAAGGDTALSSVTPNSFMPAATVAQNVIPILVSIPTGCGAMPGSGWPVVIFQHGITRSREDMFAIAGTFASQCLATVAIDLPLHGVTSTSDPFYQNQLFAPTALAAVLTAAVSERTFNMSATGAAGATGTNIDSSGAWFINLNNTITSRDNLREGAADLINLAATLPTLAAITPGATPKVNTFDASKIFYTGHSLGGIVGGVFLGADTAGHALGGPSRIVAAVLANPGGHIAELLRNSPEFEPIIDAQLAAAGLAKGTQAYYDFYSDAQAVVEDGDPANYATFAAAGHPIHILEVVGTSASTTDQVVPNSATDVLIAQMGIGGVLHTTGPHPVSAGFGTATLSQFITGDHGSLLSPSAPSGSSPTVQAAYAAVTTEMQSEAASLFVTGGAAVVVTDTSNLTTSLQQ